jgi:hypothetical protein
VLTNEYEARAARAIVAVTLVADSSTADHRSRDLQRYEKISGSFGVRWRSVAVVVFCADERTGLAGYGENLVRVPAAPPSADRHSEFSQAHTAPPTI